MKEIEEMKKVLKASNDRLLYSFTDHISDRTLIDATTELDGNVQGLFKIIEILEKRVGVLENERQNRRTG